MFPQSPELGIIIESATYLFLPVAGSILLIIVQLGGSWWLLAASVLFTAGMAVPAVLAGRQLSTALRRDNLRRVKRRVGRVQQVRLRYRRCLFIECH